MNLLDHNQTGPYRPRCGKFIGHTVELEQIPPSWSPPRIVICSHDSAERVEADVTRLLRDPEIHIVAVSPATITALPEVGGEYSGGLTGLWQPHFAITVIYQERLPAASQPISKHDEAA